MRCSAVFAFAAIASAGFAQAPTTTDDTGWVTRDHTLEIGSRHLHYSTTAGLMPQRDSKGEVHGRIFFIEYKLLDVPAGTKRPVLFVFNGGPGSSSVWLHLGIAGPKRVKLQPEGFMPPPPYELVPNEDTLLPETDLVMIDPVGTGYSRPEKPEYGKEFWGVREDIKSVGEFIRQYLTDRDRWLSPKFIMGESYGGIRAPGVSQYLSDKGADVNGIIAISPFLSSQTLEGQKGNVLPDALFLPTYAATAWYHHKLSPALEKKPVAEIVGEVRNWLYDEYMPALLRGSALAPSQRDAIRSKISKYTGLSETYVEDSDLHVSPWMWFKELLRKDRFTIGRYDTRFKGIDRSWVSGSPDYDPSDSQINGAFTATMNDYLRSELGYKTDATYFIMGENMAGWNEPPGGTDSTETLRQTLTQNPYAKFFVGMGYYDAACALGTVEQALNHMELDPRLQGNIVRNYYPSGHMIYLDTESRHKLHADLAAFIKTASNPVAPKGTLK